MDVERLLELPVHGTFISQNNLKGGVRLRIVGLDLTFFEFSKSFISDHFLHVYRLFVINFNHYSTGV